ncbi:unnamed protein product, partial [Chrysoparadoxa australica]
MRLVHVTLLAALGGVAAEEAASLTTGGLMDASRVLHEMGSDQAKSFVDEVLQGCDDDESQGAALCSRAAYFKGVMLRQEASEQAARAKGVDPAGCEPEAPSAMAVESVLAFRDFFLNYELERKAVHLTDLED